MVKLCEKSLSGTPGLLCPEKAKKVREKNASDERGNSVGGNQEKVSAAGAPSDSGRRSEVSGDHEGSGGAGADRAATGIVLGKQIRVSGSPGAETQFIIKQEE